MWSNLITTFLLTLAATARCRAAVVEYDDDVVYATRQLAHNSRSVSRGIRSNDPTQRRLEALLTRRFSVVFRIAKCAPRGAKWRPSQPQARVALETGVLPTLFHPTHHQNGTGLHGCRQSGAICLWLYRQRVGPRSSTDPDGGQAAAIGHDGGASQLVRELVTVMPLLAPDDASTGGSHGPRRHLQRNRKLQQGTTQGQGASTTAAKGSMSYCKPGGGEVTLLPADELSPFNTMWAPEALAYKAHLTALRLCRELMPQKGEGGRAAAAAAAADVTGPRVRACAVVTDDAEWVAAGGGDAMERALRRSGASSPTSLAARAADRKRRYAERFPAGASSSAPRASAHSAVAMATSVIAAALSLPPGADISEATDGTTQRPPAYDTLPWRRCKFEDASAVDDDAAAAACAVYDSKEAWLRGLEQGLTRLAGGLPGEPASGSSQQQQQQQQHPSWDVMALPSACAGWAVAPSADDAAAGAAAGLAGCVLAFTADAADAIGLLASAAASAGATSSSLLPMHNSPFFAKLGILARQGVLQMTVAAPVVERGGGGAAAAGGTTATAVAVEDPGVVVKAPVGFPTGPRRRFLLFTSSGNQGVWPSWASPSRNFDILVAYYGNRSLDDPALAPADFLYRAHGSKHQNVHRLHSLHPGLIPSYDVVAVWDDDLVIAAEQVGAMFERFAELSGPPGSPTGVWLGQPSLRSGSVVDHPPLGHQPTLRYAYTNFIEVNACVFRSDKLAQLLDSPAYSGELMGWGVDYAYLAALGMRLPDRYVVLHEFQVYNPPPSTKAEGREILKLASQETRVQQYRAYSARFRVQSVPPDKEVGYKCVPVDPALKPDQYPKYCAEYRPA